MVYDRFTLDSQFIGVRNKAGTGGLSGKRRCLTLRRGEVVPASALPPISSPAITPLGGEGIDSPGIHLTSRMLLTIANLVVLDA